MPPREQVWVSKPSFEQTETSSAVCICFPLCSARPQNPSSGLKASKSAKEIQNKGTNEWQCCSPMPRSLVAKSISSDIDNGHPGLRNPVGWRAQSHGLSLSSPLGEKLCQHSTGYCVPDKAYQTKHMTATAASIWGFCGHPWVRRPAHTITGRSLPGQGCRPCAPWLRLILHKGFPSLPPGGRGILCLTLDLFSSGIWRSLEDIVMTTLCSCCPTKGAQASSQSQHSGHNWPAPQVDHDSVSPVTEPPTSRPARSGLEC